MYKTMSETHSHIRKNTQEEKIMQTMQDKGLKQTRQRRVILEVFLGMKGHPSPKEIHAEILRRGNRLGLSTIYRTLKVLVEVGLVRKLEFDDGQRRYEQWTDKEQHLHLICTQCGQTFEAPAIAVNPLFEKLAESHAFILHNHTTYLYGLCNTCISIATSKNVNHTNTRITP